MLLRLLLIASLLELSACGHLRGEDGVFRDRKYDYRKAQATERMEIPENFDDQAIVDYYPVPEASPYADKELIFNPPLPRGLAIDSQHSVRMQRLEQREWLLIKAAPSQVWPRLKAFAQQHNLRVWQEDGAKGRLLLTAADGAYHFRLFQGFQQSYSELAIRFSRHTEQVLQWQDASLQAEDESSMLLEVARYLTHTESPVYSYLAHNISVEKRLFSEYDSEGKRFVLLKTDTQRAMASLQRALIGADFTLQDESSERTYTVQYTPQSLKTKKPGFWRRLFRVKPKPYDDSVEYAGQYYQLSLSGQGQYQRIDIEKVSQNSTKKKQSPDSLKKELNQQLQAIQGLLL